MSSDQQSDSNPQQHYNDLSNEVADILLGPDSPVRGSAEFNELIIEHDRLQSRQAVLQALDAKLVDVLPGLEQAEAQLTAAEKQLAAEKQKFAGFAGELGKSAFAGLRAGELPDNPLFADRKALQSRIDTLQRQKAELVAGENAGMMEKAKIHAQQLKLAGQIKVEELKIGSADRALGQALLVSKEKLSVRCSHTEDVLTVIAGQRQLVATARDKVKTTDTLVAEARSAASKALNRASVENATSLNGELKAVQKEASRNSEKVRLIRRSLMTTAIETRSVRDGIVVGEKLVELRSLTQNADFTQSIWRVIHRQAAARFALLSPTFRYGILAIVSLVLIAMGVGFFGQSPPSTDSADASQERPAKTGTAEKIASSQTTYRDPPSMDRNRSGDQPSESTTPRWRQPNEVYEQLISLDRVANEGVRHIEFTIVERLDSGRYHVVITGQAPATANWQIPAILLTNTVEYTSKGKSNLRIKFRGTERLNMADGFEKEFQIFEEAPGVTWDQFAETFNGYHDESKELRQQLVVSLLHNYPVKPEALSALELITGKRKKSRFASLGLESDFSSTAVGVMCIDEVRLAATKAEYAWQQEFTPLEFAACQHDTKLLDWLIAVGEGPIRAGNQEERLIEIAAEQNLKSGNSFFVYGKDLEGITGAVRSHAK